ncbi:Ribonuclease TUDOR 2, partial [Sarracenia purpurea var. burkii]
MSLSEDYTVPSIGREFGSVFLGDKNAALMVVAEEWAKVREQGQQKGDASPFLAELQCLEEQAKQQGLGRWTRVLLSHPSGTCFSAIGDPSNLDAMGPLASNKGIPMQAIVEQVRDGSTLRVYLLPSFQFVQVFVDGIQAPSMGRRAASEVVVPTKVHSDELNGEASGEPHVPLTSAQRLAASTGSSTEVGPDPFGREAKHFTEIRVHIVLEGVDKFSNLIGSVYYPDGESAKDLSLELIEI